MRPKSIKVVAHNIFGEGEVLETRWDGVQSHVKFRSGLSLWLPSRWLKPVRITDQSIKIDGISARRILEAFRMGIVPRQDIEYFTFGREHELKFFQHRIEDLKSGQGNAFVVEGGYGAGKSHILEYVRHRALRAGLVATTCALHTQETPAFRPKKVYRELVYNLRYIREGGEFGFRDLLKESAGAGIENHCFLTPVLKHIRDMAERDSQTEVFWQWIEGESTKEYAIDRSAPFRVRGGQKIPALYDFSTAADFYCYLLSGLSYLACRAGLGGLVLIIDEAETAGFTWDCELAERGMDFLEGLIRTARNDPALKKIDGRLVHNQVRPTPYLFERAHILLIIATTPQENNRIAGLAAGTTSLRKFSRLECEMIFDNLLKVYRQAYNDFALDAAAADDLLNAALKINREELRAFMKFTVEAFDWMRYNRRPAHDSGRDQGGA